MEQKISYQLYLLEGELQKAEFEYDRAYRAQENIQKRVNDYKFYLTMSGVYAVFIAIFWGIAELVSYKVGAAEMARFLIPAALLVSLISTILWLGMCFQYIKYIASYKTLREKKEQTELDLFSASQKLNSIQLKMSKLREENSSMETSAQREKVEEQPLERIEPDRTMEEDTCGQQVSRYRVDRLRRSYDETESELHNLLKEQFENDREKKRYRKLTIAGVVILLLFAVLQALDFSIFSTVFARVMVLVMPWCMIIPYSIGWLSKAMNNFWGEELWINRFIFREMHNYSIAEKIRTCQEKMEQLKKDIERYSSR